MPCARQRSACCRRSARIGRDPETTCPGSAGWPARVDQVHARQSVFRGRCPARAVLLYRDGSRCRLDRGVVEQHHHAFAAADAPDSGDQPGPGCLVVVHAQRASCDSSRKGAPGSSSSSRVREEAAFRAPRDAWRAASSRRARSGLPGRAGHRPMRSSPAARRTNASPPRSRRSPERSSVGPPG